MSMFRSRMKALLTVSLAIPVVMAGIPGCVSSGSERTASGSRTLDISAFGAKGDGVADDSAAVRAAFAAAGKHNYDYVMVYAPPGIYRLGSPVTAPLLTGSSRIIFSGASPAATVFRIDNAEGGFCFTFKGGMRKDQLDVVKFGIEVINQNTGYFLRIVGPPGGGVTHRYDARLEDLAFGATNDNSRPTYSVAGGDNDCVYLYGLKRAIVNRCFLWNTPGEVAPDEAPRSIVTLENCYKPYIQNSYFNGTARVGLYIENKGAGDSIARTEGTYIQNSTVNGPYTSCLVKNTGPEFWFTDNHCNFKLQGLSFANGRKYVYIRDNLMYVQGNDDVDLLPKADIPWQPETGVTDFYLNNVANAVIGGNIFRTVTRSPHPSSLVRTHYHIAGCNGVSIRDDKYAAQSVRRPIYAASSRAVFVSMHDQGWQRDFSNYTSRTPEEQVEFTESVTGKLTFDGVDKTTELFFGR